MHLKGRERYSIFQFTSQMTQITRNQKKLGTQKLFVFPTFVAGTQVFEPSPAAPRLLMIRTLDCKMSHLKVPN